MKNFIKNIILSWSVLLFSISNIFAVNIKIPDGGWQEDINIQNSQIESDEWDIFELIWIVNNYLWFFIWWLCMAIFVFAWIKFMTAWWDKSKISSAWKMAISCIISIVVFMFSYSLVRLIIMLF